MTTHYPWPSSYNPIPSSTQKGLIVLGSIGILSLTSTFVVTCFIIYRLIFTRRKTFSYPLRYNQSLILILNLFLADIQQALSFTLSIHWVGEGAILAPTSACTAQAWLIQIGDLASGLFSLAIALQTFHFLVLSRHLPYRVTVWTVCGIWLFCIAVSIVGPIRFGRKFFVRSGVWCWIGADFENERLFCHYLWIFLCEFGSLFLYVVIFMVLRRNALRNAASGVRNRALQRVARYMLTYPIAYTTLTLPLAAGRMASAAGHKLGDFFFIVAGVCMASSGWVDVVLYAFTRRTIVFQNEHMKGSQVKSSGNRSDLYGNTTNAGKGVSTGDEWGHDSRGRGEYGMDIDGDVESLSHSQQNIVKLEQVVEFTAEEAPRTVLAAGAPEGRSVCPGNRAVCEATGSSDW